MTDEQRKWFADFAETKENEIHGIKKGGDAKIWKYISDHYSDKAHFLYELIQNADDAGAQRARFELHAASDWNSGCLVFRHNGTKHFEITKPAPQDDDGYGFEAALKDKTLDNVYAICTVGNSTKETNDIGKFGIGFKSVFIYTDTPRIYDEGMRFEISNFVVPRSLEEEPDFVGRQKGETVFVLPFNRARGDHLPANPCKDVIEKLRTLILPTLFLKNLKVVNWEFGDQRGHYVTERDVLFVSQDGSDSRVYWSLAERQDGKEVHGEEFVLIERPIEQNSELKLTIGFGVNDGKLAPVEYAPFCYFATQVSFGLKFIVNAPFVLTSTRQSLDFASDESIANNKNMMEGLSTLLADSLVYLRDLGKSNSEHMYLTENIFRILPTDENFVPQQEMDKLNIQKNDKNHYFSGFYLKPLSKFQNEEIIPCSLRIGDFCRREDACYAEVRNIVDTFNDIDLTGAKITGMGESPRWVYAYTYDYALSERGRATNKYIEQIGARRIKAEEWVRALAGPFIERKVTDGNWLKKFYDWLASRPESEKSKVKDLPILLNQNGHACPAMINGRANLYLPDASSDSSKGDVFSNVNVVRADIHAMESVLSLERSWGMGKFDAKALADLLTDRLRESSDSHEGDKLTRQLLDLLAERTRISVVVEERITDALREHGKFLAQDGNLYLGKKLYRYSEEWAGFKSLVQDAGRFFLDWNKYTSSCTGDLLEKIGITSAPRISRIGPCFIKDINGNWLKKSDLSWQHQRNEYNNSSTKKMVSYLQCVGVELSFKSLQFSFTSLPIVESLLKLASSEPREQNTRRRCEDEIWRILLAVARKGDANCFNGEYIGVKEYSQIHDGKGRAVNAEREERTTFESLVLTKIKRTKWILNEEGSLVSPSEIDEYCPCAAISGDPGFGLARKWLGVKIAEDLEADKKERWSHLSERERKILELAANIPFEELSHISEMKQEKLSVMEGVQDNSIGARSHRRRTVAEDEFLELRADARSTPIDLKDVAQGPIGDGKWRRDDYADGTRELSDLGAGVLAWVATVEEVARKSVIGVKGMKVKPANFRIPPYQRKFSWKEENVRQLCRDLLNANDESVNYHLGTVILHRERKGDGEVWDVVDGQQRLTNIMTILGAPILDLPIKQFLVRDYEMIRRVLTDHSPELQQKIQERLAHCTLAFIAVENVSEAFQLFTTQNGRGKPLTPVNLLKAYHYKEMDADLKRIGPEAFREKQKVIEAQWESANVANIASAPCDGKLLLHVFREYLYRLRLWSRGRFPQIPFDSDRIGEFKGVTIREGGEGLPLQNGAVLRTLAAETGSFVAHRAPDDNMSPYVSICQTIVNGFDFFEYAQAYVTAYKNIFVAGDVLGFLEFYGDKCNPRKHKSGAAMYARHVFEALCLFCYDRFGSEGLRACCPSLFACAYYERVSQARVLYRRCGSTYAPLAIEKMMTTYSVADAQEALNELRVEIRDLLKTSVYASELLKKQKFTQGESLQRMAYDAIVR